MSPVPPQGYLDHVVLLPTMFLFPSTIWKDFVQIWEPVIDNYCTLDRGMSLRNSGDLDQPEAAAEGELAGSTTSAKNRTEA